MMEFKDKGKKSQSWWLKLVMDAGNIGGIPSLASDGHVAQFTVYEVLKELQINGLITGELNYKASTRYNLTQRGADYLKMHPVILMPAEQPIESKTSHPRHSVPETPGEQPVNTIGDVYYYRIINHKPRFFKNGQFISSADIPAEELEKLNIRPAAEIEPSINKEQKSEKPESDKNDNPKPCKLLYCCNGTKPMGHPIKVADSPPIKPAVLMEPEISVPIAPEATDRTVEKAVDLGIAIAEHVVNNGGVPIDDTQHPAPGNNIVRPTISDVRASLNTSQQIEKQPELAPVYDPKRAQTTTFAIQLRDVISSMILNKYGNHVTVKELLDWVENA